MSLPEREHDQDLVGLGHAQLGARLLLDHLEAFLQVGDLGLQLVVALLGGAVGCRMETLVAARPIKC